MDKALFRAYVKELVKETVEEEVRKVLPEILSEAVSEIKSLQETTKQAPKPKLDRSRLAALMGLEKHGDTIVATTNNLAPTKIQLPDGVRPDDPTVKATVNAITKDYSALMKKMGLSK